MRERSGFLVQAGWTRGCFETQVNYLSNGLSHPQLPWAAEELKNKAHGFSRICILRYWESSWSCWNRLFPTQAGDEFEFICILLVKRQENPLAKAAMIFTTKLQSWEIDLVNEHRARGRESWKPGSFAALRRRQGIWGRNVSWKHKPVAISYFRGWNRSLLSGFLKIKSATSKWFFQVQVLFDLNMDGNSFQSNWFFIRWYSRLRLPTSLWSWGTKILSQHQTNPDSELCLLRGLVLNTI